MSGSVAHDHTGSVLHLSVEDVLALPPADREELGRIMTRVAVNRGEIESTAIDVTPKPVAAPELREIK